MSGVERGPMRRQAMWTGLFAAALWAVMAPTAGSPASASAVYRVDAAAALVGETRIIRADHEDTLLDLAVEHGVGYRAIQRANPAVDLWIPGEGTRVRIPRRHLLPDAPREGIVLNLPEMRLYYFMPIEDREGTRRVATYPVGIGRRDWQTPLGRTQITQRVENPAWYPPASMRRAAEQAGDPLPAKVPPGPDNPLGRYALILEREGYLIHGTNRPYGIGMRVSHGCVRMHEQDIAELFAHAPAGTPVRIVDQPIKAGLHDGALYVEVHPELEEHAPSAGPRDLTPLARALSRAARGSDADALLEAVDWDRVEAAHRTASGVPVRVTP